MARVPKALMIFRPNCDSIIFDLDGTLWDASSSTAKGWDRVAKRLNLPIKITADSIRSVSGLPFDECAETLFSGLSKTHTNLRSHLDLAEKEEIIKLGGELYPGVLELLPVLSEKYRLFIVSNCQEWYLKAFLKSSKLESFFEDTLSFGETGLSKTENIKKIIQRNTLKKPIYIGDTQWDQHAAFFAGVKFIFARYGFGLINTKRCPTVNSFSEFCELMMSPQKKPPEIVVRKLESAEFNEAQRFYQSVDYVQEIDTKNLFFGAFHNEEMIGLVRLAFENGVWLLRGMQVRGVYQFLGIGTRLIKKLEQDIPNAACYCLPYKWLENFYGQIGFKPAMVDETVPKFLIERCSKYQKEFPYFSLMKREVGWTPATEKILFK